MRDAALIMKKKRFISWFLETYKLKRPESAKILRFLGESDELLKVVHFVENVRQLPSALIVSAQDAATVSFLCRINNVYYENVDQIMAHLEYDPPEELFVWLSFDREFLCSMCDIVLGIKPEVENKIFYHQVVKKLEKELKFKVRGTKDRKHQLLAEIDTALEKRDKARFLDLSELYRELFG
ncbi:MAG: YpiB family protein [Eubacteriales bacterium]